MNRYLFYSLLALGLAFRVYMLLNYELVNGGEVDVYLADEGVVGLMGKHILEGENLPIFFYGQHYLGALEAYAAALSFLVFGVGVFALRLVPFLFSIGLAVLVYRFAYKTYSVAAARWATAIVAVAPAYFLQWNLKARGGFVEHLFLVMVVLLLFWRFYVDHDRSNSTGFALGIAAGVATWVNQLVLGYLFVMGVIVTWFSADRRGLTAVVIGGLLGASLFIGYNVVHPLATFRTLARKAVVLNRVPIEERDEGWLRHGIERRLGALSHGAGKLGLVFGVPVGEGIEKLGLSAAAREGGPFDGLRRRLWLVPLVVFGAAFLACMPRRGPGGWEMLGSNQLLALFALVTFAVGYVSPRYMLPAYPLAAIMAGVLAGRAVGLRRQLVTAGLGLVMVFNVAGWADAMSVAAREEGRGSEQLVAFLEENGLDRCYSAAPLYHLVFESGERILLVPLQKDRYPAYNAKIEVSDSICYVFREDQVRKRQHVALLALLESHGVSYRTAEIGAYRVWYEFEPRDVLSGAAIAAVRKQETARVDVGDLLGE